jgi:hypothetical protein
MTKPHEEITQAVLDYFRRWFTDDVARFDGALHAEPVMRPDIHVQDVYEDIASVTVRTRGVHEYLHLVRGAEGWQIANAIWRVR